MAEPVRGYAELLGEFRTAVLTTRGSDGHFHARPMAMRQRVRGEEIWFATAAESKKVRDLEAEPRCALVFFDARGTTISVSGTGEVLRDRKLLRELWDPAWRRWFPAGPDQKGVALLRVIPEHVERHAAETGAVEVLFSAPRRRAAR
ncbi:MAG TPA: pyridoxamine 5'-phosphate oxidase family protein [Anaeromyxobacteraceae bacterium]|nr:pyridoxamine 5'-phosphate oxidase family protein [Anaeromyxobacteraceae bacterium]